jgi:hypothetical protein
VSDARVLTGAQHGDDISTAVLDGLADPPLPDAISLDIASGNLPFVAQTDPLGAR